jgi:hypothetical protein
MDNDDSHSRSEDGVEAEAKREWSGRSQGPTWDPVRGSGSAAAQVQGKGSNLDHISLKDQVGAHTERHRTRHRPW